MAHRTPWINRIVDELDHPIVAEIFEILCSLAQPQQGLPLPFSELERGLRTGEDLGNVVHTQSISRLRSFRPVELRVADVHLNTRPDREVDAEVHALIRSIYGVLLSEQSLDFLRDRLVDPDICPSSGDYPSSPETYYHALRWSVWTLYGRMVLGVLPPDVCLINDLPVEVLGKIIEFVCAPSAGRPYDEMKVAYIEQSLDVSSHLPLRLLCRRWNILVVGLPVAWANMVQGFGGRWSQRALDWSKNCDLSIMLKESQFVRGHLQDSARRILAHASRFSTLSIVDLTWSALAQITAFLGPMPMPRLVNLRIEGEGGNTRVPSYIFSGTPPPRLQSVTVVDCKLYPDCPIFSSSITHMVLTRSEIWNNVDDMLETLQNLTKLARLEWCMPRTIVTQGNETSYAIESTGDLAGATRRTSPISMPYLQHIALECPAGLFGAILRWISLPKYGHIRFLDNRSLSGNRSHDMSAIAEVLHALDISLGVHIAAFHSPADGKGIRAFSVNEARWPDERHSTFTVHGSTTQAFYLDDGPFTSQNFISGARTFSLTLSILNPAHANDDGGEFFHLHPDVLSRFVEHMLAWPSVRATVRKLVTNHWVFADPDGWLPILSRIPQLTELHLAASSQEDSSIVLGLASALSTHIGLLPNLQRLYLGPFELVSGHRDALIQAIDKRHNVHGHPSLTVVLVNPDEYMEEGEIEELEFMMSIANAGQVELD